MEYAITPPLKYVELPGTFVTWLARSPPVHDSARPRVMPWRVNSSPTIFSRLEKSKTKDAEAAPAEEAPAEGEETKAEEKPAEDAEVKAEEKPAEKPKKEEKS